MMIKNAWYDNSILPNEMVKAIRGDYGWKKLEYSEHFTTLDTLIKRTKTNSIIDIGCGAGEVGRVYNNLDYCGCDLSHIIENVAEVINPGKNYIKFDANENQDMSFVENYEVLLMNSFLSEIEDPLKFLKNIIKYNINYILIHRQDFTDGKSSLCDYLTYGGIKTTNSIINYKEFTDILKDQYEVIAKQNSGLTNSYKCSILLKKINKNDSII